MAAPYIHDPVLELARDADPLPNDNDGVLPTDVLYEVLLRVPAKPLCRLRLVCRSWRSLTSGPRFARAHSARHPLFVALSLGKGEIHIVDMYSGSIVKRIYSTNHAADIKDLCSYLSTQTDLVCFSTETSGGDKQDIVLNPATGAVKILPDGNRPVLVNSCILAYVPSTGEYKVLRLSQYLTFKGTLRAACHVIALGHGGDQRWRAKPSPVHISSYSCHIAVVHEVAYFWSYKSDDDGDNSDMMMPRVALFDLANEEWRPGTLPGPMSRRLYQDADQIQFNSLDGFLVIIHHKIRDCSTDLWFLMGVVDNNRPFWTKRYSMRCVPQRYTTFCHPCPLVIFDDGRLVAWSQNQPVLTAYDPSTGTWEDLTNLKYYSTLEMYQGSLLCSDLQG